MMNLDESLLNWLFHLGEPYGKYVDEDKHLWVRKTRDEIVVQNWWTENVHILILALSFLFSVLWYLSSHLYFFYRATSGKELLDGLSPHKRTFSPASDRGSSLRSKSSPWNRSYCKRSAPPRQKSALTLYSDLTSVTTYLADATTATAISSELGPHTSSYPSRPVIGQVKTEVRPNAETSSAYQRVPPLRATADEDELNCTKGGVQTVDNLRQKSSRRQMETAIGDVKRVRKNHELSITERLNSSDGRRVFQEGGGRSNVSADEAASDLLWGNVDTIRRKYHDSTRGVVNETQVKMHGDRGDQMKRTSHKGKIGQLPCSQTKQSNLQHGRVCNQTGPKRNARRRPHGPNSSPDFSQASDKKKVERGTPKGRKRASPPFKKSSPGDTVQTSHSGFSTKKVGRVPTARGTKFSENESDSLTPGKGSPKDQEKRWRLSGSPGRRSSTASTSSRRRAKSKAVTTDRRPQCNVANVSTRRKRVDVNKLTQQFQAKGASRQKEISSLRGILNKLRSLIYDKYNNPTAGGRDGSSRQRTERRSVKLMKDALAFLLLSQRSSALTAPKSARVVRNRTALHGTDPNVSLPIRKSLKLLYGRNNHLVKTILRKGAFDGVHGASSNSSEASLSTAQHGPNVSSEHKGKRAMLVMHAPRSSCKSNGRNIQLVEFAKTCEEQPTEDDDVAPTTADLLNQLLQSAAIIRKHHSRKYVRGSRKQTQDLKQQLSPMVTPRSSNVFTRPRSPYSKCGQSDDSSSSCSEITGTTDRLSSDRKGSSTTSTSSHSPTAGTPGPSGIRNSPRQVKPYPMGVPKNDRAYRKSPSNHTPSVQPGYEIQNGRPNPDHGRDQAMGNKVTKLLQRRQSMVKYSEPQVKNNRNQIVKASLFAVGKLQEPKYFRFAFDGNEQKQHKKEVLSKYQQNQQTVEQKSPSNSLGSSTLDILSQITLKSSIEDGENSPGTTIPSHNENDDRNNETGLPKHMSTLPEGDADKETSTAQSLNMRDPLQSGTETQHASDQKRRRGVENLFVNRQRRENDPRQDRTFLPTQGRPNKETSSMKGERTLSQTKKQPHKVVQGSVRFAEKRSASGCEDGTAEYQRKPPRRSKIPRYIENKSHETGKTLAKNTGKNLFEHQTSKNKERTHAWISHNHQSKEGKEGSADVEADDRECWLFQISKSSKIPERRNQAKPQPASHQNRNIGTQRISPSPTENFCVSPSIRPTNNAIQHRDSEARDRPNMDRKTECGHASLSHGRTMRALSFAKSRENIHCRAEHSKLGTKAKAAQFRELNDKDRERLAQNQPGTRTAGKGIRSNRPKMGNRGTTVQSPCSVGSGRTACIDARHCKKSSGELRDNQGTACGIVASSERLKNICSPEACRLCGTHTVDSTTCDLGRIDKKTSHLQYTLNTQVQGLSRQVIDKVSPTVGTEEVKEESGMSRIKNLASAYNNYSAKLQKNAQSRRLALTRLCQTFQSQLMSADENERQQQISEAKTVQKPALAKENQLAKKTNLLNPAVTVRYRSRIPVLGGRRKSDMAPRETQQFCKGKVKARPEQKNADLQRCMRRFLRVLSGSGLQSVRTLKDNDPSRVTAVKKFASDLRLLKNLQNRVDKNLVKPTVVAHHEAETLAKKGWKSYSVKSPLNDTVAVGWCNQERHSPDYSRYASPAIKTHTCGRLSFVSPFMEKYSKEQDKVSKNPNAQVFNRHLGATASLLSQTDSPPRKATRDHVIRHRNCNGGNFEVGCKSQVGSYSHAGHILSGSVSCISFDTSGFTNHHRPVNEDNATKDHFSGYFLTDTEQYHNSLLQLQNFIEKNAEIQSREPPQTDKLSNDQNMIVDEVRSTWQYSAVSREAVGHNEVKQTKTSLQRRNVGQKYPERSNRTQKLNAHKVEDRICSRQKAVSLDRRRDATPFDRTRSESKSHTRTPQKRRRQVDVFQAPTRTQIAGLAPKPQSDLAVSRDTQDIGQKCSSLSPAAKPKDSQQVSPMLYFTEVELPGSSTCRRTKLVKTLANEGTMETTRENIHFATADTFNTKAGGPHNPEEPKDEFSKVSMKMGEQNNDKDRQERAICGQLNPLRSSKALTAATEGFHTCSYAGQNNTENPERRALPATSVHRHQPEWTTSTNEETKESDLKDNNAVGSSSSTKQNIHQQQCSTTLDSQTEGSMPANETYNNAEQISRTRRRDRDESAATWVENNVRPSLEHYNNSHQGAHEVEDDFRSYRVGLGPLHGGPREAKVQLSQVTSPRDVVWWRMALEDKCHSYDSPKLYEHQSSTYVQDSMSPRPLHVKRERSFLNEVKTVHTRKRIPNVMVVSSRRDAGPERRLMERASNMAMKTRSNATMLSNGRSLGAKQRHFNLGDSGYVGRQIPESSHSRPKHFSHCERIPIGSDESVNPSRSTFAGLEQPKCTEEEHSFITGKAKRTSIKIGVNMDSRDLKELKGPYDNNMQYSSGQVLDEGSRDKLTEVKAGSVMSSADFTLSWKVNTSEPDTLSYSGLHLNYLDTASPLPATGHAQIMSDVLNSMPTLPETVDVNNHMVFLKDRAPSPPRSRKRPGIEQNDMADFGREEFDHRGNRGKYGRATNIHLTPRWQRKTTGLNKFAPSVSFHTKLQSGVNTVLLKQPSRHSPHFCLHGATRSPGTRSSDSDMISPVRNSKGKHRQSRATIQLSSCQYNPSLAKGFKFSTPDFRHKISNELRRTSYNSQAFQFLPLREQESENSGCWRSSPPEVALSPHHMRDRETAGICRQVTSNSAHREKKRRPGLLTNAAFPSRWNTTKNNNERALARQKKWALGRSSSSTRRHQRCPVNRPSSLAACIHSHGDGVAQNVSLRHITASALSNSGHPNSHNPVRSGCGPASTRRGTAGTTKEHDQSEGTTSVNQLSLDWYKPSTSSAVESSRPGHQNVNISALGRSTEQTLQTVWSHTAEPQRQQQRSGTFSDSSAHRSHDQPLYRRLQGPIFPENRNPCVNCHQFFRSGSLTSCNCRRSMRNRQNLPDSCQLSPALVCRDHECQPSFVHYPVEDFRQPVTIQRDSCLPGCSAYPSGKCNEKCYCHSTQMTDFLVSPNQVFSRQPQQVNASDMTASWDTSTPSPPWTRTLNTDTSPSSASSPNEMTLNEGNMSPENSSMRQTNYQRTDPCSRNPTSNFLSTPGHFQSRPVTGFSYLHSDAPSDYPNAYNYPPAPACARRPTRFTIKVRGPKENTFVGRLVKLFESKLRFRPPPSPDLQ